VTVVGAGTIGSSWAAFFALSGLNVRVADPAPGAAAAVAAAVEKARPGWPADRTECGSRRAILL
jgi:carnitine 3-dehydrogenase